MANGPPGRSEAAAAELAGEGNLSDLQREYLRARNAYRASGQAMKSTPTGSPAFQSVRDAHDRATRRFYSLTERLPGQERLAARQATGAAAFMDEIGGEGGRPRPHWSNNPQLPDVEKLTQEVERARRLGADNPHIPRLAERAQELERELRALLSARAEAEGVSVGRRGPRGPAAPGDLISTTSAEASDRILARQHFENARKILGEEGFVGHVGPGPGAAADAAIYAPRRAAAKAALKGVGGLGLGLGLDWLSAYGEGARDIDDWMAQEEEFLTGLPGLVSPSELPPPAVLSADRKKAVEATQGMTGVAPDPESDNVTLQEVRAYIKNKVAKGEKLQKWADKITSMESGRLSIKPVNPRSKARQEAAKPQNPRMGAAKRKHGVPTRADTINRENRRKAKAGY